jgi:acyl carrier protein
MSQVSEEVREILTGVLDIPPDQVTPELGYGQVEAWDSFGHLQIILALEGQFGIQFSPEKIPVLTTVALLQKELQAQGKLV